MEPLMEMGMLGRVFLGRVTWKLTSTVWDFLRLNLDGGGHILSDDGFLGVGMIGKVRGEGGR